MTTVMSVEHIIGNRHSYDKENIKSLPVYFFVGRVHRACCNSKLTLSLIIIN